MFKFITKAPNHSGVVYHANYLKYFERARSTSPRHFSAGKLFQDQGIGFVVYKQSHLQKGAQFGDHIRIETNVEQGVFRLIFNRCQNGRDNSVRRRNDRFGLVNIETWSNYPILYFANCFINEVSHFKYIRVVIGQLLRLSLGYTLSANNRGRWRDAGSRYKWYC